MHLIASACLQIMQLPGWQRCALVLGGDLFFIACCVGFLYLADAYGRQRHGKTARYPGGPLPDKLLLTGNLSRQMTHRASVHGFRQLVQTPAVHQTAPQPSDVFIQLVNLG